MSDVEQDASGGGRGGKMQTENKNDRLEEKAATAVVFLVFE